MQTAGETTVGMAIAYIAGVRSFSVIGLLGIIALGTIYHGIGFSWNNIYDYSYDKDDPHKSDLPLVAGRLDYFNTTSGLAILTAIMTVVYIYLALRFAVVPLVAVAAIILAIGGGFYYDARNKRTNRGQIGIIVAFPSLTLYAFMFTHTFDFTGILIITYATAMISYLNLFSGQMKDIGNRNQANFLRYMGSTGNGLSQRAIVVGFTIKAIALMSIAIAVAHAGFIRIVLSVSMAFASWILAIYSMAFFTDGGYRNQQIYAVLVELTGAIAFIIAFTVSPYVMLLFVAYPVVWMVLFNRYFFGSLLFMKV
jgi:4-hydroxybenzoate polyprenyltransferase